MDMTIVANAGPMLISSAKDCFNVEGLPSTIGFTSFIKHGPVKSNSAVVQTLLDLGAVLYVKTNIPQTMMVCRISKVVVS